MASTRRPDPVINSVDPIVVGTKYDYVRLHVTSSRGKAATREIVRHPGAVVVVPVLDDGRVVLIRNFRLSVRGWIYECCAGTIERARNADGSFGKGEEPAACAARELVEETGYKAGKIEALGSFFTTPG